MRGPVTVMRRRVLTNALELRLRRCKGSALQDFFGAIMAKVHGDNFVPGGTDYSRGDLQCDGLLREPLTVFACYGPVNAGAHMTKDTIRVAVAKVRSDFEGAKEAWGGMRGWFFVTNYLDAPMQVTHEVLKVAEENPDIEIGTFGRHRFETTVAALSPEDIELLLGFDAIAADFTSVQPGEILSVVRGLMARTSGRRDDDSQPAPVPSDKLDFNGLEPMYRERLSSGFRNARDVGTFLSRNPDPLLEEDLASVLKAKYLELDCQGLSPGDVLDGLYQFTLAGEPATTPREVAVWGVLAYFFEKCTIFRDRPAVAVDGDPLHAPLGGAT